MEKVKWCEPTINALGDNNHQDTAHFKGLFSLLPFTIREVLWDDNKIRCEDFV
jgi:hypothetical protein